MTTGRYIPPIKFFLLFNNWLVFRKIMAICLLLMLLLSSSSLLAQEFYTYTKLTLSDYGYSGYKVELSADFKEQLNKASGGSFGTWTTGQPLPALALTCDGKNVNCLAYLFNGCSNIESLDLSNFNTVKVTDMKQMFSSCSNLTSLTLGSNFSTANVTDCHVLSLRQTYRWREGGRHCDGCYSSCSILQFGNWY